MELQEKDSQTNEEGKSFVNNTGEVNETDDHEDTPLIAQQNVHAYKERWLALFIFALNTFTNGMVFISLSSINSIASNYYNVTSVNIEWLTNMMNLGFMIFALPATYLISRFGVRPMLIIGAFLHLLTSIMQYIGHVHDNFSLIMIGQIFSAIGSSTIIQVPGKLSANWFPENERATSTSIGILSNLLGTSFGFLQPTLVVRSSSQNAKMDNELKLFFVIRIIICIFSLLLSLIYRESPPTPASPGPPRNDIPFIKSFKILVTDKNFILISQSFAIYSSLFSCMNTLVNPLVTSQFSKGYETLIGWMGFGAILAGIVSFLILGRVLDKWHRYRLTSILLNMFSLIIWLIFFTTLMNSKNFSIIFTMYVLFGVCMFPFFAGGIEQAAEMTYPVPEESSSVTMLLLANVYGFAFNLIIGYALQGGYIQTSAYIVALLYIISTFLACETKTELKRFNAECVVN